MSKIRHAEELALLPREGSFLFRDYLPRPPGGKATYWAQMGLIRKVGRVRLNCRSRRSIWALTDRARRILGRLSQID